MIGIIRTGLGLIILFGLLLVLGFLVCVRGLLLISKVIKSYRIVTIIGLITVVKSFAATSQDYSWQTTRLDVRARGVEVVR